MLSCSESHRDDEIGLLIKGYNQQKSDQKESLISEPSYTTMTLIT